MLLLVWCQGWQWHESQVKRNLLWQVTFESALSLLVQVSLPYMKIPLWISKMITWGWKTYSRPSNFEPKVDFWQHFWQSAHWQKLFEVCWTENTGLAKGKQDLCCLLEMKTAQELWLLWYLYWLEATWTLHNHSHSITGMEDWQQDALYHTCHNCLFLFPTAFVKLTFILIFSSTKSVPSDISTWIPQCLFWLQFILHWFGSL